MNIQLIYDDIRFIRYRLTCHNLSAALRTAMEARMASLERELILLKDAGAVSSSDATLGWA